LALNHTKHAGKSPLGRAGSIVLVIVLTLALLFATLVLILTITEFKPPAKQTITIDSGADMSSSDATAPGTAKSAPAGYSVGSDEADRSSGTNVTLGQSLSVLTWNIGYGALGDQADFFMDGGKMVRTSSKTRVEENIRAVKEEISSLSPDFAFLQEIDRNSSRSYRINEYEELQTAAEASMFAQNYRSVFVPYPIPPIGSVDSGIATLANHPVTGSERVSLPCPFSWPNRLGNLKRCLLVSRTSILDDSGKDTGRELVLVNLHLEAYDSGEGKAAQTKQLRELLESEAEKGNFVIAGGDFNQSFSGTDTSMYPAHEGRWHCGVLDESEFPDSLQFITDNSTPSCRSLDQPYKGADHSKFQYYLIDGFIVSSNVTVDDCSTLDLGFVNSDHNPVLLKAVLEP
jgi:endonuclease/exonuclease/phosphatase family metal-dependent hydrolase